MNQTILLTIDVEDWFQVENLRGCFPLSSWPDCKLRIEKNVHRLLGLLDTVKLNNGMDPINSPKATFFVLGWIAERLPHLVREIQSMGHEVASHGYDHVLCREQPIHEFKIDLVKSKKLLEEITGRPVYGYRAPGFSISNDILNLIEEAGYLYDSSFNSFRMNKRYGQIELNPDHGNGVFNKISGSFYELPISNVRVGGRTIPWGGGGYFRLLPFPLFKKGIQFILKNQGTYLFYMHPWEIDPEQPRASDIPVSFKFRHYLNLDKTYSRLSNLLKTFGECRFPTCFQYITSSSKSNLASPFKTLR